MKIRTDFVTNSSSSNYIIEQSLIRESPASLVGFHRQQSEVLSSLRKVWTDTSSLDPKLAWSRYTIYDIVYNFCKENQMNPIEGPADAAAGVDGQFLSGLREFIEADGSTLFVVEAGYSSAAHMEESVALQLGYLWSHLDGIALIPYLSESIKQVYEGTALRSWLGRGKDTVLPPIERTRTHNHCTYFNETLGYVLMTILLLVSKRVEAFYGEDVNAVVEKFAAEYSRREAEPGLPLPDGLSLLAKGMPAEPGSFPEYPTDVWLARFADGGELLGVYSVHIDELPERLSMPVDEAFPPIPFAKDFWSFWQESDDHNVDIDYGYALLRYHEEAVKQRPPLIFDFNIQKPYPKGITGQDKEYIENFLGEELEEDGGAEGDEPIGDELQLDGLRLDGLQLDDLELDGLQLDDLELDDLQLDGLRLDGLSEEEKLALDIGSKLFDLSIRSFNSLRRAGVITVSDILAKSRQELGTIRNFSKKCLGEVELKLGRLGFELHGSPDPNGGDGAD